MTKRTTRPSVLQGAIDMATLQAVIVQFPVISIATTEAGRSLPEDIPSQCREGSVVIYLLRIQHIWDPSHVYE